MTKTCVSILIACLVFYACSANEIPSEIYVSRNARLVIGSAQDLDPRILPDVDQERLKTDWLYQRQVAWDIWADLTSSPGDKTLPFQKWQSWYAKEDLQRIFHHLYQAIGKEGRAQRRQFTTDEINLAFAWHDQKQYLAPDWDQNQFDRWLAKYDTDEKQQSIPGMSKALINRAALQFFLEHYDQLHACAWQAPMPDNCSELVFPAGSVLLKTAWQRAGDEFLIPFYDMNPVGLRQHFSANTWQSQGQGLLQSGEAFSVVTSSGNRFFLTGIHGAIKLNQSWLWTSLWLGSEPNSSFGLDKPDQFATDWRRYEMCVVKDFHKLDLDPNSASIRPLVEAARLAQDTVSASWCSNPYLEIGDNNQFTNCVGCHQHAGSAWSSDELLSKLQTDLPKLIHYTGAISSDLIWSVYNGPDPLAALISQEIEYFDIYDQF